MKLSALVLVLSTGLAISHGAIAESFNDRGGNWVANPQRSATVKNAPVAATPEGYVERGENWIVKIGTDAGKPRLQFVASLNGFNERGES